MYLGVGEWIGGCLFAIKAHSSAKGRQISVVFRMEKNTVFIKYMQTKYKNSIITKQRKIRKKIIL